MNPVIRVTAVAATGSVSGVIDPASAHAFVWTTMGLDTVTTSADHTTGAFKLWGLVNGTYAIRANQVEVMSYPALPGPISGPSLITLAATGLALALIGGVSYFEAPRLEDLFQQAACSTVEIVASDDAVSGPQGLEDSGGGSQTRRKSSATLSFFEGCQALFQGSASGVVCARVLEAPVLARRGLRVGRRQVDGRHHRARADARQGFGIA